MCPLDGMNSSKEELNGNCKEETKFLLLFLMVSPLSLSPVHAGKQMNADGSNGQQEV